MIAPICPFCRHFQNNLPPRCAAFPAGVPDLIWTGGDDHARPVAHDNGVRFERRQHRSADQIERMLTGEARPGENEG